MKVYFNSIGHFIEQDTSMDLFVKGNNGNVVECYFNGLDISDTNLKFRLLIKWSDGTTTNELPMNKSLKDEYVYLSLPTLKVEGETQFIIRMYDYETIQHTAIFERVVLENIDASDDTISSEEYEILLENIESKQDVLISGSNIKTINGESIVGSGNIEIKAKDINLDDYVTQDEFQEKVVNEANYIVECNHRHEITGITGDEYKLAIGTQQMKINKVSGRTLVKNQCYKPTFQGSVYGGGYVSVSNDIISLSGTPTVTYIGTSNFTDEMNLAHKYMFELEVLENPNNYELYYGWFNRVNMTKKVVGVGVAREIITQTTSMLSYSKNEGLTLPQKDLDLTGIKYRIRIIDLTLAYGVGNEPTTIEEILNDFPEYIPYNKGEFVHSDNKLISTGKNIWNEEVALNSSFDINGGRLFEVQGYFRSKDYIKVAPNTRYYIKNNATPNIAFYDLDKIFIDFVPLQYVNYFETPANCHYIIFANAGTSYNNDICINLYDESFNGTYQPYKEEVVEVGELKEYDYIDNVNNVKYINSGEVDLGDLDWEYSNGIFINYNTRINLNTKERGGNLICTKYGKSTSLGVNAMKDKTIQMMGGTSSSNLWIKDSAYTDAKTFKNSLQGVKLLYEIATPTIIEDVNLPIGMYVTEGGYQIQEGTIPYVIEKEYALNIVSQVKQNIQFDREQQEQINGLKNFLYQPLDYIPYYVEVPGSVEIRLEQDTRINLYQTQGVSEIYLEGHRCILTNLPDDELTIYNDPDVYGDTTIYNYANIPISCFTWVSKGGISFEGLQSAGIGEILIEFVNNCFIIRSVFIGGM